MMTEILFNTLGGLALFLLAMSMMTGGLKVFIGTELRHFIQHWTSSPLRGMFSGVLVTALVQSSSAVTVAAIGFVNAGVLTMRHALGVVFGANVGTTMTGWLVSLVGFGVKIDALAMPILACGVALRFLAPEKRHRALGDSLAGFGLFFLGLSVLQGGFAGVAESFGTEFMASPEIGGILAFLLMGFVATVLTQSSSAAIALILMAASQSLLPLNGAAAAVIGANIGTTSTAVLAAINATPNAKRVAAGHVAFNLITGAIALAILPGLLWVTSEFGHLAGLDENPVTFLALFHTLFNLLGVVIMLPLAGRLASLLDSLFHSDVEEFSRPQFLDKTVIGTPALAVYALRMELLRLTSFVCSILLSTLQNPAVRPKEIERKSEAVLTLVHAVHEFATTVRMEDMARDASEALAQNIRIVRYLDESAALIPETAALVRAVSDLEDIEGRERLKQVIDETKSVTKLLLEQVQSDSPLVVSIGKFESLYQGAKASLLRAAATHTLSPEHADSLLDELSRMRRMVEQITKAAILLRQSERGGLVMALTETSPLFEGEGGGA